MSKCEVVRTSVAGFARISLRCSRLGSRPFVWARTRNRVETSSPSLGASVSTSVEVTHQSSRSSKNALGFMRVGGRSQHLRGCRFPSSRHAVPLDHNDAIDHDRLAHRRPRATPSRSDACHLQRQRPYGGVAVHEFRHEFRHEFGHEFGHECGHEFARIARGCVGRLAHRAVRATTGWLFHRVVEPPLCVTRHDGGTDGNNRARNSDKR